MLECVVNVSEGQRADVLDRLARAAGDDLLDVHADPDHHRAVLTLVGEDAARAVARLAVEIIDLRDHVGAHPRLGAVDVVPFVALGATPPDSAVAARERYLRWSADELGVPGFRYGTDRSLPEVRRHAFRELAPDTGGPHPHPSAGATAVGARGVLVAYNVWLAEPDLATARRVAAEVRGEAVRALGLAVGARVQVSMNLVDPARVGPAAAFDAVARRVAVAGAELVGLVPATVLDAVPRHRWAELDLADDRTIEARLAARRR
ncbi:MAG TPA: hypothetical protein VK866_13055 [Acidimicrobiales bacterium]|nr:hypothetical protein [Acidimicrobiales bacterium]